MAKSRALNVSASEVIRRFNKSRKLFTLKARLPWTQRSRFKSLGATLTGAEKSQANKKRMEFRQDLNAALESAQQAVWDLAVDLSQRFGRHAPKYYFELLMQQSRVAKGKRRVNRWNAYIYENTKRINAGEWVQVGQAARAADATRPDVPEGERRSMITALVKDLRVTWNAMTREQQIEVTKDAVKELEDQREVRSLAVRNVAKSCYHDTRATLASIEERVWTPSLVMSRTRLSNPSLLDAGAPCSYRNGSPHVRRSL